MLYLFFFWSIGDFDFNGMSLFFLVPSIFLSILPSSSFFIFLTLFSGLRFYNTGFLFFNFEFFQARVFKVNALGLYLYQDIMGQVIVPRAAKVYVSNHDTRFLADFGFCVDYFLHYLFKASWCLILLLYFNFDWRLEAFPKIADYCLFI